MQIGKPDRPDDRRGGAIRGALSERRDIALDMAWPWSLSPLTQRPKFRANEARKRAVCGNDHDQARRDNRKPKQAMSRTELPSYSQSSESIAHASVKAALSPLQNAMRCSAPSFASIRKLVGGTPRAALASASAAAKIQGDPVSALPAKQALLTPSHDLQIHWEQTMSIFGKIMSAIFGTKADAAPAGGSPGRQARPRARPHLPDHRPRRRKPSMSRRSWTRRSPPRRKSWNGAPRSSI